MEPLMGLSERGELRFSFSVLRGFVFPYLKLHPKTIFYPENGEKQLIDSRELVDEESAVVVYSNPLDNVTPMAHHFFKRCLDAKVMPCVVTKKTVFKWQEVSWW